MGKTFSFRQLVADKMTGYNFESCEIADTINTAKTIAREFTASVKAADDEEEKNAIKLHAGTCVVGIADAMVNFEFWQKVLNERLHEYVNKEIASILENAVHEYGKRNNESWLTNVSLSKLGIEYTDTLCDTENRCLSALCDVLNKLYSCKRTKDTANADKRTIHALASNRLKDLRSHYGVTLTRQLIHAILADETEKFAAQTK